MTNSHEALEADSVPGDVGTTRVSEVDYKVACLQRGPRGLRQDEKGSERNGGPTQEEEEEDVAAADGEMIPPDGGWGWMVALGTFIIMTLVPMSGRCFGVIFSPYLLQEGSSSATTAWIFNIQCFIWNVMGPITGPLTREFGWRKVAITGAALASVSLMISAFAPSPAFLFFSYSLLTGVGGGVVVLICFCILPLYFDYKRGMANAILSAGVSVGPMVGAPLTRHLQDEFGFRGATLILGALALHSCVGACFFHPVEWHLRKSQPQVTHQPQEVDAPLMSPESSSKFCVTNGFASSKPDVSFTSSNHEPDSDLERVIADARMRRHVGRPVSEASWSSRKNSSLALSLLDVTSVLVVGDPDRTDGFESDEDDSHTTSSVCTVIQRVALSTVSGLKVLRFPRACIVALGGCLCLTGYFNFMMTVPFAMQASGHTLEDAAWCLSVASICNLLVRLLVSILSDWPWFKIQKCYTAGLALISFTMFIFPLLTDLRHLLLTMALFGCGIGSSMGLYNLVMIDVMGLEYMAQTFGACSLTVAVGFITLGPLIGFVRDVSNSYALSMWIVAGMLLTSFTLWLFMPAAVRYDQRRSEEKEQQQRDNP